MTLAALGGIPVVTTRRRPRLGLRQNGPYGLWHVYDLALGQDIGHGFANSADAEMERRHFYALLDAGAPITTTATKEAPRWHSR